MWETGRSMDHRQPTAAPTISHSQAMWAWTPHSGEATYRLTILWWKCGCGKGGSFTRTRAHSARGCHTRFYPGKNHRTPSQAPSHSGLSSLRVFTGGDRTVRGYEFEQLSPANDEGASIGGRYLISGSIEGDYFFTRKYGIAAFFDHGNAVNSIDDPLESSFGLGFRYRTPVGVLRIDVARPMRFSLG